MKKIYFILFILCGFGFAGFAQVFPKGMNYQAVARTSSGKVVSGGPVTVKVYLFANTKDKRTTYYSETHTVTTNAAGLFDLVIGEGRKIDGEYGLVPWNKEDIWLEVTAQTTDRKQFYTLSSSRLMAVPYAMHAFSTEYLDGVKKTTSTDLFSQPPGVDSQTWSVFGNANTINSGNLYHTNALGTTDKVDLIMITDNVERLRILKGGDIFTKLNFEIGKDLNVVGNTAIQQALTIGDSLIVKKNVILNTMGGSTINYGPFTVSHGSPTLFSGILTVDQSTLLHSSLNVHGPTDLNNRLYVNNMSPTALTGTLQVNKATDLNDALHVNNMSPTHLTGTLRVDKSTNLNDSLSVQAMGPTLLTGRLQVDKTATINDSLIVSNMSPTALTGTLKVGKDALFNENVLISDTTQSNNTNSGALVIHGGLGVGRNLNIGGASTFLGPVGFASPVNINDATQSNDTATGALVVSGGTGINRNLNVGGTAVIAGMTSITDTTQSTSTSSGALKVIGGTGIVKNLNVGGMTSVIGETNLLSSIQSTTTTTGALIVAGGVGIAKELNVGGMTKIWNNMQSSDTLTGALKVSGGMGIGAGLTVGGMTSIFDLTQSNNAASGALKVSGGVGIGLQLNVGGMTSILSTSQATSTTTGALRVTGGVGISKNLNIKGAFNVTGLATLSDSLIVNNTFNITSSSSYIADFINTTNANGISIQVGDSDPGWDNNYVTFRNSGGGIIGRIEGENKSGELIIAGIEITPPQFKKNETYKQQVERLNTRILTATVMVSTAVVAGAISVAYLVAASNSYTPCVGFPVNCVAVPIISLIIYAGLNAAGAAIDLVAQSVALGYAVDDRDKFVTYKANTVGVTYESGNGDYAEWLPKSNPKESFLPGYIVGMKNGLISKKIDSDSKPLVISTKPIVLGNMPQDEDKTEYEKVAFLGQVPVHVMGHVNAGDYILPSGNDDGLGKAIHPSKLKIEDYAYIVGVAWTASENDAHSLINVAIGLNSNALARAAVDQKNKIHQLKEKFNKRNLLLARLLPGYKEASDAASLEIEQSPAITQSSSYNASSNSSMQVDRLDPMNLDFSPEQLNEILDKAEKIVFQSGGYTGAESVWNQLKANPGYKEQILQQIKQQIQTEIPKQFGKIKLVDKDK